MSFFHFSAHPIVYPVRLIIINDHDPLSVIPPLLVNMSILNNPTPHRTSHMIHEQPLTKCEETQLAKYTSEMKHSKLYSYGSNLLNSNT